MPGAGGARGCVLCGGRGCHRGHISGGRGGVRLGLVPVFLGGNTRWLTQGPVAASAVGQSTRGCGRLITSSLAGFPPSAMRALEPAQPDHGLLGGGSWR